MRLPSIALIIVYDIYLNCYLWNVIRPFFHRRRVWVRGKFAVGHHICNSKFILSKVIKVHITEVNVILLRKHSIFAIPGLYCVDLW